MYTESPDKHLPKTYQAVDPWRCTLFALMTSFMMVGGTKWIASGQQASMYLTCWLFFSHGGTMVISCFVVGCSNRQGYKPNVAFYQIPFDEERKQRWINREDWQPSKYSRICSELFFKKVRLNYFPVTRLLYKISHRYPWC